MSNKFTHLHSMFRKKYSLHNSKIVQWFPGHMQKGLLQIQAKLKKIDCIIEIHDARIPYSGRNLRFRDIIKLRPHVLLLNKVDLTDIESNEGRKRGMLSTLKEQGVDTVYFTNLRQTQHGQFLQKEILPATQKLIDSRPRYDREGQDDYNFLVVGIPNVGKSTFINALRATQMQRKGKATTVGARAGITRSVLSKIKVSSNPSVYVIDTPGIMPPKIPGLEVGMRLASCACLPDHLVGEVNIADYILFWLNSRGHFDYVDHFDIEKPTDDVLHLLAHIAMKNKKVIRIKNVATNQYVYRPDNLLAAQIFYTAFRNGQLGKFVMDDDY